MIGLHDQTWKKVGNIHIGHTVKLLYTQRKKKHSTLYVHFLEMYEDLSPKYAGVNSIQCWVKEKCCLVWFHFMDFAEPTICVFFAICIHVCSASRQQMSETQRWVRPYLHCIHSVPIKDHQNGIQNHNFHDVTTSGLSQPQDCHNLRLSQPHRDQAIGMRQAGRSARIIARTFGVHHSTVVRLAEHYLITGSSHDRARSGRPHVATAAQTG